MNRSVSKIKNAISLWNEGHKKFDEASSVLRDGPESYYFKRIEEYVDALFVKFAPFKKGDRVVIVKAPDCNNGWAGCKHFLIKGAIGTVHDVDYYDGQFVADVAWDNETWIDQKGKKRPVKPKNLFHMSEKQIKKVEKSKRNEQKN